MNVKLVVNCYFDWLNKCAIRLLHHVTITGIPGFSTQSLFVNTAAMCSLTILDKIGNYRASNQRPLVNTESLQFFESPRLIAFVCII